MVLSELTTMRHQVDILKVLTEAGYPYCQHSDNPEKRERNEKIINKQKIVT